MIGVHAREDHIKTLRSCRDHNHAPPPNYLFNFCNVNAFFASVEVAPLLGLAVAVEVAVLPKSALLFATAQLLSDVPPSVGCSLCSATVAVEGPTARRARMTRSTIALAPTRSCQRG